MSLSNSLRVDKNEVQLSCRELDLWPSTSCCCTCKKRVNLWRNNIEHWSTTKLASCNMKNDTLIPFNPARLVLSSRSRHDRTTSIHLDLSSDHSALLLLLASLHCSLLLISTEQKRTETKLHGAVGRLLSTAANPWHQAIKVITCQTVRIMGVLRFAITARTRAGLRQ